MTTTEPIEHSACRERTTTEAAALAGDDLPRAEQFARAYTETFERLAPHFGFAVEVDPRRAWEQAPPNGRSLLVAVFRDLLPLIEAPLRAELGDIAIDRDRWRRIVELLARAAEGRPGVEHVAALAETLACVTALRDRWRRTPGYHEVADELDVALDERDQ